MPRVSDPETRCVPAARGPAARLWRPAALGLGLVFLAASGAQAGANELSFDDHDVATAFSIRRSLNRNRVDYAVRLDVRCRAKDAAPIVPYWRMLETDANFAPLLPREQRAFGIASQHPRDEENGSVVEVRLRALRTRPVLVHTRRGARGCEAEPVMRIAGVDAELRDIYVVLANRIQVDHIVLRGRARDDGRAVEERLRE